MKKITISLSITILLVTLVTAATVMFLFPYDPKQPPRADDTGTTPEGLQEVVLANNKFAFDLYHVFDGQESENLFYSPYSIFSALSMTAEGARGTTAEEMQHVMHLPEQAILRPNIAALYNHLNRKNTPYELLTGNALWVQEDFPLHEEYMNITQQFYGGKTASLDFLHQAEASRATINEFISQQTNKRIPELVPSGVINSYTRLVLTNAIYFNGDWKYQFDRRGTQEMDFKKTPQETIQVQMMSMNPKDEQFKYMENEMMQMIELPYKGDTVSMTIIVPAEGESLATVESALTAETFAEYQSEMIPQKIQSIHLPRFEFDTTYSLQRHLSTLGMPTAFDQDADFSGMSDAGELYISEVVHKGFIKVDEKGTEAAAATAVLMRVDSVVMMPTFKADRPFLFFIQDSETGAILFMGKVVDPRS